MAAEGDKINGVVAAEKRKQGRPKGSKDAIKRHRSGGKRKVEGSSSCESLTSAGGSKSQEIEDLQRPAKKACSDDITVHESFAGSSQPVGAAALLPSSFAEAPVSHIELPPTGVLARFAAFSQFHPHTYGPGYSTNMAATQMKFEAASSRQTQESGETSQSGAAEAAAQPQLRTFSFGDNAVRDRLSGPNVRCELGQSAAGAAFTTGASYHDHSTVRPDAPVSVYTTVATIGQEQSAQNAPVYAPAQPVLEQTTPVAVFEPEWVEEEAETPQTFVIAAGDPFAVDWDRVTGKIDSQPAPGSKASGASSAGSRPAR
eukprot:2018459-Rhodomonas_salina.1